MSRDDEREPEPLRADARRMLATWRDAEAMPSVARARVWRRLRAEPQASAQRPWVWAWAFAIAAAVLLAWWGVVQLRHSLRDGEAVPREQAVDAPAPVEEAVVDRRTAPAPAAPIVPPRAPAVVPVDAPPPIVRPSARPNARTADPPPPSVPAPASALVRERDLIARAWSALADGDPGAALHRAAEHEQSFPDGILAPERRAIVVIARCKRGDRDAEAHAQQWLQAQSRSPLAGRVRTACDRP